MRWTRSLPLSRPASSSMAQTPLEVTLIPIARRRYLFWMLWVHRRRQRKDITPPSGRFRKSHPLSSRVLQKACQNKYLGQPIPYHWRQNNTNSFSRMLRRDSYVCSTGDWVTASFSMDVLGGTKKAVAHFWCQLCEMIQISAARWS